MNQSQILSSKGANELETRLILARSMPRYLARERLVNPYICTLERSRELCRRSKGAERHANDAELKCIQVCLRERPGMSKLLKLNIRSPSSAINLTVTIDGKNNTASAETAAKSEPCFAEVLRARL